MLITTDPKHFIILKLTFFRITKMLGPWWLRISTLEVAIKMLARVDPTGILKHWAQSNRVENRSKKMKMKNLALKLS